MMGRFGESRAGLRFAVVGVAFALLGSSAATARADDRLDKISDAEKHTAKELVKAGDEKFRAGSYQAALNDYRGADAIMRVPTTGIEVARTLAVLGRLLEARDVYQRVASYPKADEEPSAFTAARDKAVAAAAELDERIPRLTVAPTHGTGVSPVITIDGASTPPNEAVPLDPGEHLVEVSAVGHVTVRKRVELVEKDRETMEIVLQVVKDDDEKEESEPQPVPVAESAQLPWWTWIGVGVAGVGGVVGGVTGGISLSKASDVKDQAISDGVYPESARATQEESVTLAHVSTVSFAVGGAGAALAVVGLVLYMIDDGEAADPPVSADANGMVTWRF
jgi:hypothetical protein